LRGNCVEAPEIEAVEFDQIEGTEHCCVVMVAITEEFENRKTNFIVALQ